MDAMIIDTWLNLTDGDCIVCPGKVVNPCDA